MQIHKIQNNNYNPIFKGYIKIQNLKKSKNIIERKTSCEVDRGISALALKNIFGGNWTNEGYKYIPRKKIIQYAEVIKQTLGIELNKSNKELELIKLKNYDNGYSIKNKNYKLTHIREDHMIWE